MDVYCAADGIQEPEEIEVEEDDSGAIDEGSEQEEAPAERSALSQLDELASSAPAVLVRGVRV